MGRRPLKCTANLTIVSSCGSSLVHPGPRQPLGGVTVGRRSAAEEHAALCVEYHEPTGRGRMKASSLAWIGAFDVAVASDISGTAALATLARMSAILN